MITTPCRTYAEHPIHATALRCLALALLVCGTFARAEPAQPGAAPSANGEVGDGRTVFVRDLTTAEASGVQRVIAQKDWIYVADTLRTGPKSTARFVMRDHTLLAMKPATSVVLAEYQFKVEDSKASKMVTKVTSGSLRALTGLIDKRDPDKVVLQTPLATAGVRGTAIRVDLYPSGIEEIIFDFGRGWVGNRAGRVEVPTGWGARVISASILPELFKVGEDPEEPAFIALELLDRPPLDFRPGSPLPSGSGDHRKALDAIVARSAERARKMDPADLPVLIGLLEQVPEPDAERSLAIIEGLLLATRKDDEALIQTAVQLVPARATRILEIATRTGSEPGPALRSVLGALLPMWASEVPATLKQAERLGVTPEEADGILESIRQSVPCRPAPVAGTGSPAGATVACAPATSPALAAADPSLLALGTVPPD